MNHNPTHTLTKRTPVHLKRRGGFWLPGLLLPGLFIPVASAPCCAQQATETHARQTAQGAARRSPRTHVRAKPSPPAPIFRRVLEGVKRQTPVAALLPGELPAALTRRRLYASGTGDANGYSISLTSRPRCGANSCFVGVFKATAGATPIYEDAVRLTNDITGHYKPTTCGGSCSPPEIEWVIGGVLYSIQLDVRQNTKLTAAAEKSLMILVARSAIEAGAR